MVKETLIRSVGFGSFNDLSIEAESIASDGKVFWRIKTATGMRNYSKTLIEVSTYEEVIAFVEGVKFAVKRLV